MFINNGKSLFGNTGLIISILVLIILVYFSYNKCYTNNTYNNNNVIDTFFAASLLPPIDLRISISNNNIIVNYSLDNSSTNELPTSFIIVLAQYDINKKNTGNNKFYISNEKILNPSSESTAVENYTCTIIDGIPVCKYIFTNNDVKDTNNNAYYYKVGVSAMYKYGDSPYVTPGNISNTDKMFTLATSLNNQNKIISNQPQITVSANAYNNTISTADGQYELIKSQLGNYPDNLFLDSQTINSNSLSDLVDKSMAQALLNVNVST
jgi:hypothetical protein